MTPLQDYRAAVRVVMFETGIDGCQYATDGGTAFVIDYCGGLYALTCWHVVRGWDENRIAIIDTNGNVGPRKVAAIRGIYRPTAPRDDAVGTDIEDLCAIAFKDECDSAFFKGTAYLFDATTVSSAQTGHRLTVFGNLKDKTQIDEPNIFAGIGLLQFTDAGPSTFDPILRHATALYLDPAFDRITGVSGAPVFNEMTGTICGMVVRGGMKGSQCEIYYVDGLQLLAFVDRIHRHWLARS